MSDKIYLATRDLQLAIKADTEELLTKIETVGLEQDPYNTPGPQILKIGTLDLGYFGFVAANELITGNALASNVGITEGTAQFSDAGWLKWVHARRILFVAKKTFRHSISWNHIDSKGAVFGTKTISIGGKSYKVRLLTGVDTSGSEWNTIMYGAHQGYAPPWDNYNDQDLHTDEAHGNGSYSWCQDADGGNRVLRGDSGVAGFRADSPSYTRSDYGWRPCLELIS